MKPRKNSHTVHLISLGCAKNTVDSASMADLLTREGYQMTEHAGRAGVIIINTCGFIGPAREESYQVLSDLAAHKRQGQLLIAAGCLTQRYGIEVARRVKGIDGIIGTRRWMDIVDVVQKLNRQAGLQPVYHLPESSTLGMDERGAPRLAVQGGSAYLKIADGCRRPCAFCAIPMIKGTAISRPMDAILNEARFLVAQGVSEINLIAQDTTDYGYDLGLKDGLARLLEKLTDPDLYGGDGFRRGNPASTEIPWIRVLYAYPGFVTDRLIEIMAHGRGNAVSTGDRWGKKGRTPSAPTLFGWDNPTPTIVHYLDMPLQHAHPDTLRRMRRPANIDWVYNTLDHMRRQIPDLALRTTFIVGYPGETEAEFQILLDFVKAIRFDRVGAFQFSFETGTPSEPLGDPIPPEVKEERYNRLMELQQGISLEINQTFLGKTLPVLIEGQEEPGGILVGRSYRDAPEIDGVVVIEDATDQRDPASRDEKYSVSTDREHGVSADTNHPTVQPLIGKIVPVRITGAMAYDLNGILDLSGRFDIDEET